MTKNLKEYEKHLRFKKHLTDSTVNKYLHSIELLLRYLYGKQRRTRIVNDDILLDVTPLQIEAFFNAQYLEDKSKATRKSLKTGIRNFYMFKGMDDVLKFNGNFRKTKKEMQKNKQYLNDENIKQVREVIRQFPEYTTLRQLYRYYEKQVLIELLIATGMSKAEVLGLKYSDVNFEKHYIWIHKKKTEQSDEHNGYRRFPIVSTKLLNLITALKSVFSYTYNREPSHVVHVSSIAINTITTNIGKKINFPLHPHLFRHYRITKLRQLRRDGRRVFTLNEVSKMTGVCPYILIKYYDHPDNDAIQAQFEMVFGEDEA